MTLDRPGERVEVSIIVPVYNGQATIRACVDSLLALDSDGVLTEIICVDNGSKDASWQILESYGDCISRLQEAWRGAGPTRNAGVRVARGNWLAFVDCDCVVHPDWLKLLLSPLQSGAADVTGGPIRTLPGSGAIAKFGDQIHDQRSAIEQSRPPYVASANFATSADWYRRIDGFDARWLRGQDSDFSFRLARAGARFAYADGATVWHKNHNTLFGLAREGFRHGYYGTELRRVHEKLIRDYRRRNPEPIPPAVPDSGAAAELADWQRGLLRRVYLAGKHAGRFLNRHKRPPSVFRGHPDTVLERPKGPGPCATIVMPLLRQVDEWLKQSVLSAVQQTVPVEVIVVTSPFTPESNRHVLAALEPRFRNLRVVERPHGKRFAGALNHGISLANTDRIGFLLTDDWMALDCVEKCLFSHVDLVSTAMDVYAEDGRTELKQLNRTDVWRRYLACTDNFERASFLGHFFLIRREAILLAGGVDETLGDTPGVDDLDLIWSLLEHGATVQLVDEPLYHCRDHAGERLTTRTHDEMRETYSRILRKHGMEGEALEERVEAASRWFGQPLSVVYEAMRPPTVEPLKSKTRKTPLRQRLLRLDPLFPARWVYRQALPYDTRVAMHERLMILLGRRGGNRQQTP